MMQQLAVPTVGRQPGRGIGRRVALTLAVCAGAIAGGVTPASATTVTLCNATWPDGPYCPSGYAAGPRHTYTYGQGASAGSHDGHMYADWYVAYTSSNGSYPKYSFGERIGNILNSYMSNNTELLRGYIFTFAGGGAPLYHEGRY